MVDHKILPEEIFQKREQLGLNNSVRMLSEIIDTGKNTEIRKDAINYLGKISKHSSHLKKECYEILENILISDDNSDIKCEAAISLGKTQYEKALKPLKWALEQETTNNELKEASLRAIANIRFDEPEIKLFIQELDNRTQSIKNFIKNQLIMLNPEDSIKILLRSLKTENFSQDHKAEIINLIGLELSSINITFEDSSYLKIKYPELFSELIQSKDILLEHITKISIQDNSELMKNVLAIFNTLGEEINKDLIRLLLKEDFITKKNAIKLVGKLKLTDAVDFLIINLDNIYSEVSIASIEALGEIGDLSSVPELLNVLNIEDISYEYLDLDMKFYILDAVKKIYLNNKDASYDELFLYLESENDTIKESIAFIFGEIAKDEFVKPLVDLLDVKNVDVKKNSVIAMGKIGNMESLDPLIQILEAKYSYWIIKKVAVDAIYHIYQKNSYLLAEAREESRRKLTKSTAKLIDYLSRKDKENFKVKLSLIRFLEEYGGEPALNALLKRVNDFHRVIRIYASNAIKKIEEKLELENSH